MAALHRAQLSVPDLRAQEQGVGDIMRASDFEPRSSGPKTAHSLDMVLTAAQ